VKPCSLARRFLIMVITTACIGSKPVVPESPKG
jgi:hypothetical protein